MVSINCSTSIYYLFLAQSHKSMLYLKWKQIAFCIDVVEAFSKLVAQSHYCDQLLLYFPRERLSILIKYWKTDFYYPTPF